MFPGRQPAPESRQALFLDRDGVLNEEIEYLHDVRDLVMIPGAGSLIGECNRRGIAVVMVSNQAGIGRQLYDASAFEGVSRAIEANLARAGASIDAWYFCPHLPEAGCPCRKPSPGMLQKAASEMGLRLLGSVMVGDKITDLEAARAVSVRTVLVRTGHGRREERRLQVEGRTALADVYADSLADARDGILSLLGQPGAPGGDPR